MVYRILTIVIVVALVGGTFLLLTHKESPSPGWVITASHPVVIGGYGDNFSYSGTDVRPLSGKLALRFDPASHGGTITISVTTTEKSGAIMPSVKGSLTGSITLSSRITPDDSIISDKYIYGDTGIRSPKLPETYAYLAGEGTFDLYLNGKLVDEKLYGEWALAQALRKEDGAIRKSGLVYSPLLRDKTGFADPKKAQFILILHSPDPDPNNNPPYALVLHLVFTAVKIAKSPQKG